MTRAAIVSGYAPPEANVPGGSVERTLGLIERRPNLAAVGANVLGRRLDRRPDSVVERVAQSWSEEDRRTVLGSAELRKAVAKTLSEATRTGSTGVVLDAQLLGAPWGFDVSEASGVPIAVHHGGADDVAPAAMGQWFHEHLRGSTLSFDPTAGHITYTLKHVAEIFKPFAGNAKGASPIPDVAEPLVR